MKLQALPDKVKLSVKTTSKHFKDFNLPKMNIHYWYPFNLNFTYRYTEAKDYLYLVKEKGYTGANIYRADILKRTKPLENKNGVMFHPQVFFRNKQIMLHAKSLGLPIISEAYTMQDVQKGFNMLDSMIQSVREDLENRFVWNNEDAWYITDTNSEEWDENLYSHATVEELTNLQQYGEIYSMLTLMRKLCEA